MDGTAWRDIAGYVLQISRYEARFVPRSDIIRLYDIWYAHFPVMFPFIGLLFQKMIHLWGFRFVLLRIKINLPLSRVNGKTVQREKKTSGDRNKDKKKNPDKSRKRGLSPQLSVHQEVSPRESALAGLITEAAQEVPQKEKEVSSSSRK